MAMILDAMAERKLKVSQLADELPRYEIVKTKITLPREKIAAALTAVERHFREAAADRLDGLRLDWPGQMAAGAGQQYRADRAGHRRSAQPNRGRTAMPRSSGRDDCREMTAWRRAGQCPI